MHVKSFLVLTYLEYTFGGRPLSFVTKILMMNSCKKKERFSFCLFFQNFSSCKFCCILTTSPLSCAVKGYFSNNLQGTLRHNPLKRLMTLITDYSKVNSNNQSRNKFLTLRWQILQRGDILMTACWQQFDGKSFTVQWQIKTIPNSQSKSMLP